MSTKQKKLESISMERRPRQLKDFLFDESNSCSSTGFKSYPRRPPNAHHHSRPSSPSLSPYNSGYYSSSKYSSTTATADPTVKKLIQIDRDNTVGPTTLQRSRSKSQAAADATISAIQKLLSYAIDTVSIAPRRRVRSKFWDKKKTQQQQKITAGVNERELSAVKVYKVKDILRWKSFRDLVADKQSQQVLEAAEEEDETKEVQCPLDSSNLTAKTSAGSTYTASSCTGTCSTSASNSKGSSWGGDSEFSFTVEELPCWWSNSPNIGGGVSGSDVKKFNDRPDGDGDKRSGVGGKGDDDGEMESLEETAMSDLGPEGKEADNYSEDDDEEGDQNSPVSVLDHESPFTEGGDDDENYSADDLSFHQSLANIERTKSRLLQSLQWFENLAAGGNFDVDDDEDDLSTKDDKDSTDGIINSEGEDENELEPEGAQELQETEEVIEPEVLRAQNLIHHMKSTSCMIDNSCEHLLFDFFMQELKTIDQSHDDERFEMLMENEASAYLSRRVQRNYSTGVTKAAVLQLVIREKEMESRWSVDKYEQEEKEQLVLLMEKSVLNTLVDELLVEML